MAPMPRLPSTISAAWQSEACSRMDSPTPAANECSALRQADRLLSHHMAMQHYAPAPAAQDAATTRTSRIGILLLQPLLDSPSSRLCIQSIFTSHTCLMQSKGTEPLSAGLARTVRARFSGSTPDAPPCAITLLLSMRPSGTAWPAVWLLDRLH